MPDGRASVPKRISPNQRRWLALLPADEWVGAWSLAWRARGDGILTPVAPTSTLQALCRAGLAEQQASFEYPDITPPKYRRTPAGTAALSGEPNA